MYPHDSTSPSGGGVTLRLFAALRIGASAATELHAWAHDALRSAGVPERDATLVDPTQYHVTWAFLGDVVEEHVPAVARAIERAASEVPGPTSCRVVGAGQYGSGRVLGADVDVELLPLLDAARDHLLDTIHPYAPAADERSWRPHVTLIRARGGTRLPDRLLTEPTPPAAAWIAPELRLLASLPAPGGRAHRVLHAVPFGTTVPAR